ncbi:tetratricopeptide repeat protein [Anoxybacterium hadale]|uniref:Tetratricopeptide repeat protein n=1 Tax=Anoxybacterium hadale TaxID=3408580 RepID=A0ACD1AC75_9FIRM|nr:tetratricopeptide repeat protein [Clostridiales bacterium]
MNRLEIVDNSNGTITMKIHNKDIHFITIQENIPFEDPTTIEERQAIQWYLRKFLTFPFGAEIEKAKEIELKLKELGTRIFHIIFNENISARNSLRLYNNLVEMGIHNLEIILVSNDLKFLNIPWELIYDPHRKLFLALEVKCFYRQQRLKKSAHAKFTKKKKIDILIIISRPYGVNDIPFSIIVKPILEAFDSYRDFINIDVLRPPTLSTLEDKLLNKSYDLIHFDGHGLFVTEKHDELIIQGATAGLGHLIFEDEDGGEQLISARGLGDIIEKYNVPVFILNACESATGDDKLTSSSIANQLLECGVNSVIAMSGLAHKTMTVLFMGALYSNIAKGKTIADSFAISRRRLYEHRRRESLTGILDISDWMIPTLFQQDSDFNAWNKEHNPLTNKNIRESFYTKLHLETKDLVGRDLDIIKIERAILDSDKPWILLKGAWGTGKTELAKWFSNWFFITSGCSDGVYYTSFTNADSFTSQVIDSLKIFNNNYLSSQDQLNNILAVLREKSCLLIWDNLEIIEAYSKTNDNVEIKNDMNKLSSFLKMLKGGRTRVILISRKTERWLEVAYQEINVKSLEHDYTLELAEKNFNHFGKSFSHYKYDYDLYNFFYLLNGHPYSIPIILKQLDNKSPEQLVLALRGIEEVCLDNIEEILLGLFNTLDTEVQEMLMFLGFHSTSINSFFVEEFIRKSDAVDSVDTLYYSVYGKLPSRQQTDGFLKEGERIGFIEKKINYAETTYYSLSPFIPAFLRKQFFIKKGQDNIINLKKYFIEFHFELCSAVNYKLHIHDADWYVLMLGEINNTISALYFAIDSEQWTEAQQLTQAIIKVFTYSGVYSIKILFLKSMLAKLDEISDKRKNKFWVFISAAIAEHYTNGSQSVELDHAEVIYDILLGLPLEEYELQERDISVFYLQKSIIQFRRRNLDDAKINVEKSLQIREKLESKEDIAYCYNQLAMILKEQNDYGNALSYLTKVIDLNKDADFDKKLLLAAFINCGNIELTNEIYYRAEDYFFKALSLVKDHNLTMPDEIGLIYNSLGMIYEEKELFSEAEKLYKEAIKVLDVKKGLKHNALSVYHNLGKLYEKMKLYDDSERWLLKCIEVKEELGWSYEAASTYHELGITMTSKREFDKASIYFEKALQLYENDEIAKADTYFRYAILRVYEKKMDLAMSSLLEALKIAEKANLTIKDAIISLLKLIE